MENLQNSESGIRSVAFTPNGRGLVCGGRDKVEYWDVSCLADGPDGHSNSPGVSRRDPLYKTKKVGRRSRCTMNFVGHRVRVHVGRLTWEVSNCLVQGMVRSVAVSHDGLWVVSASDSREVRFWDAKTGIVQLILKGRKGPSGP